MLRLLRSRRERLAPGDAEQEAHDPVHAKNGQDPDAG
jgi:hypothetical protein